MLSKTSSSSSPGNGDYNNRQIYIPSLSYKFWFYLSNEHLKNEDAEAPPVDGARVRRLREHFGGEELWGAAEGARAVAVAHALLAQTKVGDFHVSLCIQQEVVQFEISENFQIQ